jgi:hypothetical protein
MICHGQMQVLQVDYVARNVKRYDLPSAIETDFVSTGIPLHEKATLGWPITLSY